MQEKMLDIWDKPKYAFWVNRNSRQRPLSKSFSTPTSIFSESCRKLEILNAKGSFLNLPLLRTVPGRLSDFTSTNKPPGGHRFWREPSS